MFIGGMPMATIEQMVGLLDAMPRERIHVCCSGSFRIERAVYFRDRTSGLHSNDVSFFSCVLGAWLAGDAIPFRFKGDLERLEQVTLAAEAEEPSPIIRPAAAALALTLSEWKAGKANPFKEAHIRHVMGDLPGQLVKHRAKLARAFGQLKLAGFSACDWLEHLEDGLAKGATILSFPPFYKSGYERLYKWLDANVEWAAPTYPLFEPDGLPDLVRRLEASGAPYIIVAKERLDDPPPRALTKKWGGVNHWLYASTGAARLTRTSTIGKPFPYQTINLAKVSAKSQLRVTRASGPEALYVRNVYVKNTIEPAPALQNYFIWIDDMLAGVISLSMNKMANSYREKGRSCYLMGDISTTRDGRLSKLISRLAINRDLVGDFSARLLDRFDYVLTTAFADNPVSMKYRGLFELLSRKTMGEAYQLQYGAKLLPETPQEAFDWWWANHGDAKRREARPGGGRGARAVGRG